MDGTLFSNARIIDPERGEIECGWLLQQRGSIVATGIGEPPAREGCEAIDCVGMCLAPGLIDAGVKVGEPGERHKESYQSAGAAAVAGGVTTIITRPDTKPAIDSPETLEFVKRRANTVSMANFLPMAALTKGRDGKEMTEIRLLQDAGAAAFSDCDRVIADTKVFARALSYARSCNALIIAHPQDQGLSVGATATAGKFASLRGLPAVSVMAERIGLERDIALVEMTKARYHADQVTTATALPALKRAKEGGLDITAGVSIHHLTLNSLDVADYRTFFKVKPPLRSEEDRCAAVQALSEGLIDVISSMHTPQDEESKRLPFEEAASGAVALETLLPAALRLYHGGQLSLTRLFQVLALNPANRLGLPAGRLRAGAPADLILFDPDKPFVVDRHSLRSKSKNTPFDGQTLQGRILGTWVGGKRRFDGQ
ncbi:MAG: dihydroorotase [Aestuariivita sp.]|nr:dihydroorotase [Aestuariivita sp.]MCY4203633.1 dihydroorotase [Aestuariivita sp.]